MVRTIPLDVASQRKGRLLRDGRYGENAAGKWVRSGAFREIDYDPENPDKLREFDNFDAAFAFDEECRLNGTGGRKAVHLPKPKDTVPKDQLALEKAMKHAVEEDGNKTRVHLENVEENITYLQKMVRKIPLDAASQRKGRLLRDGRYGENAAGKWVRSGAFREID